jgi:hypothetical protein
MEIFVRGVVEEQVETGREAFFRQPVTDHDGDFWQRVKHNGNVRFELFFHLLTAENVDQVIKKIRVNIRYPLDRFLTSFTKQWIEFLSALEFPEGFPISRW